MGGWGRRGDSRERSRDARPRDARDVRDVRSSDRYGERGERYEQRGRVYSPPTERRERSSQHGRSSEARRSRSRRPDFEKTPPVREALPRRRRVPVVDQTEAAPGTTAAPKVKPLRKSKWDDRGDGGGANAVPDWVTSAGPKAEIEVTPDRADPSQPTSEPRILAPPAGHTEPTGHAGHVSSPIVEGLRPGKSVRVSGLKGDAALRLNGEKGVLESWNAASNRWNVRLRSGEVKAIRAENLHEVLDPSPVQTPLPASQEEHPDDPPFLEVWSRREASERAKATEKLLGPTKLDLSVPAELLQQAAKRQDMDPDPDAKLLSSVDDERVVLDDLDTDLQLRSSGWTAKTAKR